MQILKSIGHHPHILRLIGCCTGLGPLLVVLELCEHGNLRDFLRKHRPKEEQRENSEDVDGVDGDISEGSENGMMAPGTSQKQQKVMYQVKMEGIILGKKLN